MKVERRKTLRHFRIGSRKVAASLFSILLAAEAQAQARNHNPQSLTEISESLRELSARISPSVVQIVSTGYGLEADEQHTGASVFSRQRNTGSGIIVSDDGYIMTNAHVLQGARSIRVKLSGQGKESFSQFDAKLIGTDSVLDLALVKIQASNLVPLPPGNSLDVKQGEL